MKPPFQPKLIPLIFGLFLSPTVFAQPRCVMNVDLVNHNRYAYQTAEECGRFFHSTPWGNWGVNSNVGTRLNTDQFQGWRQPCGQTKVEWNSCSSRSRYRSAAFLNFPNLSVAYPYPANGYPFGDLFEWNDSVPPYGNDHHVDQYSPCGPSVYGGFLLSLAVSARIDTNDDGILDAGGCADLNGQMLDVRQNFMSVYEMDAPDSDDLVESLYYPDLAVTLRCTLDVCVATGDEDFDGWIDDVHDPSSPGYLWPILYQDNRDVICQPSDPGVPCRRIDATIRIGRVFAYYLGP